MPDICITREMKMKTKLNMKKIIVLVFFFFTLVSGIFAQTMTVFEHSNSFEEIIEQFQIRAKDISTGYDYFGSGFETNFSPVLNEENRNIIGEDKFAVLWLSSAIIDLNFLFLYNMESKEAIVFSFQKEYLEGLVPCSLIEMSRHLTSHIINVYKNPKWYQKPEQR
jgi:hypothetical protein